jgi:hypothetical protein
MIDLAAAQPEARRSELAGQAIDNAIGQHRSGRARPARRRHRVAGRVRVARGDGPAARNCACSASASAWPLGAAGQLHRRARLGQLRRDDDRSRRRNRLRAVDRHALSHRARARRHPVLPSRVAMATAGRSVVSPASPSSSPCSACSR